MLLPATIAYAFLATLSAPHSPQMDQSTISKDPIKRTDLKRGEHKRKVRLTVWVERYCGGYIRYTIR